MREGPRSWARSHRYLREAGAPRWYLCEAGALSICRGAIPNVVTVASVLLRHRCSWIGGGKAPWWVSRPGRHHLMQSRPKMICAGYAPQVWTSQVMANRNEHQPCHPSWLRALRPPQNSKKPNNAWQWHGKPANTKNEEANQGWQQIARPALMGGISWIFAVRPAPLGEISSMCA